MEPTIFSILFIGSAKITILYPDILIYDSIQVAMLTVSSAIPCNAAIHVTHDLLYDLHCIELLIVIKGQIKTPTKSIFILFGILHFNKEI